MAGLDAPQVGVLVKQGHQIDNPDLRVYIPQAPQSLG